MPLGRPAPGAVHHVVVGMIEPNLPTRMMLRFRGSCRLPSAVVLAVDVAAVVRRTAIEDPAAAGASNGDQDLGDVHERALRFERLRLPAAHVQQCARERDLDENGNQYLGSDIADCQLQAPDCCQHQTRSQQALDQSGSSQRGLRIPGREEHDRDARKQRGHAPANDAGCQRKLEASACQQEMRRKHQRKRQRDETERDRYCDASKTQLHGVGSCSVSPGQRVFLVEEASGRPVCADGREPSARLAAALDGVCRVRAAELRLDPARMR